MATDRADVGDDRVPDEAVRQWFLADFAAHTILETGLPAEHTGKQVAPMGRNLAGRSGMRLRRFMFRCWDGSARRNFLLSYRLHLENFFLASSLTSQTERIPTPLLSKQVRASGQRFKCAGGS